MGTSCLYIICGSLFTMSPYYLILMSFYTQIEMLHVTKYMHKSDNNNKNKKVLNKIQKKKIIKTKNPHTL